MFASFTLAALSLSAASGLSVQNPALGPIDPVSEPAEFAARCVEAAQAQRNRVRAATDFWRSMNEVQTWWSARLEEAEPDAVAREEVLERARAQVAPYDRPGMQNMVVVGSLLATCRETRAVLETGSEG
jgi:hypothetical protein